MIKLFSKIYIHNSSLTSFLFVVIISLMIGVRDILHIPINKYLFVMLFATYFFITNVQNIINVICFMIPMLNGLPGNWILLVAICILIFKDFKFSLVNLLFPLLVAVAEMTHALINQKYIFPIGDLARYLVFLTIVVFLIFNNYNIDYKKSLYYFAFGVITALTLVFITTLQYYPIDTILNGTFRYGFLGQDVVQLDMLLNNNNNNIAYYSVLGFTVFFILMHMETRYKLVHYILIIATIFFGVLTMSRAFLITAALAIILYYILSVKSWRNLIWHAITSLVFCASIYYIIKWGFPYVYQGFLNRFQEVDISGGRIEILKGYMDFISSNLVYLIFGTGLLSMKEITGYESAPHNGFQQVLVAYGMIGFLVFLIIVYIIVKYSKNHVSVPNVAYLPLITMMVFVQSIQLLAPFELMMPMIICSFCIKMYASARLHERETMNLGSYNEPSTAAETTRCQNLRNIAELLKIKPRIN